MPRHRSLHDADYSSMSQPRTFLPAEQAISPLFVGIDLGGTNIKLGLVDNLGRPLAW